MTFVGFEQFSRVAPLGVRFWDVAAQVPVTSGLVVTARTPQGRILPMFANSQGVHVLQDVPGLRPFEMGDGSDDFWDQAPVAQVYTLVARDSEARFHPFTFEADVPTRGIASWNCVSQPPLALLNALPGYIPVYSIASRSIPGGMAAVRADLTDPNEGIPAAWAVLEVSLDSIVLGRGIADRRGCALVVFPFPEPIDAAPDSPLSSGVALTEQTWTLSLRAYYAPVDPIPAVPNLCTLLKQPEADLWREWNTPADNEPLGGIDLLYGREAIAQSFDSANKPLSSLYITPS